MNEVSRQWRHPQELPPNASYSCTSCCPIGYWPPCKERLCQSSICTYAFLFSSLIVEGESLLPHSASVMSSTRRADKPVRYISMRASSTPFFRQQRKIRRHLLNLIRSGILPALPAGLQPKRQQQYYKQKKHFFISISP